METLYPVIPETITVHLGTPDSAARNVTVEFPDYIKNVASSEIYPTWPDASLRANIYAQISFALNRVYTEHYRSLGYDFDITDSTAYDQAFSEGRETFENTDRIVDEIFNSYIRRVGTVEPLFALYCNGTTVTCDGLSQWGTVELAKQGLTPYEILATYYGNDIEIVSDAPIRNIEPSVPGVPLRLGAVGNDVRFIQVRLNRISANYPAIPKINPVDGIFGTETEEAVRAFQRIFDLTEDGIVGKATWYKIQFVFNAVKRLGEVESEGLAIGEIENQFPSALTPDSSGVGVTTVQYYLRTIALFNPEIPSPPLSGYYGTETEEAVAAFQSVYGLPSTGTVDEETWNKMFDVYLGMVDSVSPEALGIPGEPFPGRFLKLGSEGEDVLTLQTYLNAAAEVYEQVPTVPEDGVFGEETRDAVYAVQAIFDYPITGTVGVVTWNTLAEIYETVASGSGRSEGQYPGSAVFEEEENDES